jgi:hypothetical protein
MPEECAQAEKERGAAHAHCTQVQPHHCSSPNSYTNKSDFTGQCQEMDIFFKGLNILFSTFCVPYALMGVFKSLSLTYTIINFLFASLKLLTNFENGRKGSTGTLYLGLGS